MHAVGHRAYCQQRKDSCFGADKGSDVSKKSLIVREPPERQVKNNSQIRSPENKFISQADGLSGLDSSQVLRMAIYALLVVRKL